MPARVLIFHDYPYPARAVWDIAVDPRAYVKVMEKIMTFQGWDDAPLEEGKQIDVTFRLFGTLPPQPYHMRLETFSPGEMHFKSHEWGGTVKSWDHALRVEDTPTGARLTDDVTIDAGWLTPVYAAFARFMYRQRHPVRLKLLADQMKMETA